MLVEQQQAAQAQIEDVERELRQAQDEAKRARLENRVMSEEMVTAMRRQRYRDILIVRPKTHNDRHTYIYTYSHILPFFRLCLCSSLDGNGADHPRPEDPT